MTCQLRRANGMMASAFIGLYREKTPAMRQVIDQMIDIIYSDTATLDEATAAVDTLAEALLPSPAPEW